MGLQGPCAQQTPSPLPEGTPVKPQRTGFGAIGLPAHLHCPFLPHLGPPGDLAPGAQKAVAGIPGQPMFPLLRLWT